MSNPTTVRIPAQAAGIRLSEYLTQNGYPINAPCGGRGTCGKCKVKVLEGNFASLERPGEILATDADGYVLACRAVCTSAEALIELPHTSGDGWTEVQAVHTLTRTGLNGYGIALDIGTTTLAAVLIDRSQSRQLSATSRLNPQKAYGADVISRINACKEGKLQALQSCVLDAVKEMIAELTAPHPTCIPDSMTVAGNTTMLHIFAGVSPVGMGAYPFTPEFTDARIIEGKSLGLSIEKIILLPSISAFVGSDVVAGLYSFEYYLQNKPVLFVDVGTNGEMVLYTGAERGGRFLSASTAAGPAFEGANISCGVGGISGAVSGVSGDEYNTKFTTINDAPAIGICGCGLIDLIAHLLERGDLDETGYLEDDPYRLSGDHQVSTGSVFTETSVYLTGKDVREFQLAKSAIRAGIEALLDAAEIDADDLQYICFAGGIGNRLSAWSTVRVGLLPDVLRRKITPLGNSALRGAILCLVEPNALEKMTELAGKCESFELADSSVFMEQFIEQMMFPEVM